MTEINSNVVVIEVANVQVSYTKEKIQKMPASQISILIKQAASPEDRQRIKRWISECHGD